MMLGLTATDLRYASRCLARARVQPWRPGKSPRCCKPAGCCGTSRCVKPSPPSPHCTAPRTASTRSWNGPTSCRLARRKVSKCSGGEQQRLKFALALLPDPRLLILDEPTAGMDVAARHAFWDTMREDALAGAHRPVCHPLSGGGAGLRRTHGAHRCGTGPCRRPDQRAAGHDRRTRRQRHTARGTPHRNVRSRRCETLPHGSSRCSCRATGSRSPARNPMPRR